jgi:hypothetical protein
MAAAQRVLEKTIRIEASTRWDALDLAALATLQQRANTSSGGRRSKSNSNEPASRSTHGSTRPKRPLPSSAASSGTPKPTQPNAAGRSRRSSTRVWQDKGLVVAVKPREPFMRYFKAADELAQRRARNSAVISGSDGDSSPRPPA